MSFVHSFKSCRSNTIYTSINLSFNTVHKVSFEHYLYLPSLSSQSASSLTNNRYTPKILSSHEVGKKNIRLYPKRMIGKDWPDANTHLAMNVNKMALLTSGVSNTLVVDTLADQFGATIQVQVHFQIFLSSA